MFNIFKPDNKYDAKRQKANKDIVKLINQYIDKYPEQRFIQILWNLGIIQQNKDGEILDKYCEEPWITLMRIGGNNEK